MSKKFHYKAPAIVALTIAGTAITTHQAFADSSSGANTKTDSNRTADQTQQPTNQTKNSQVQTKTSNTNVAGTQAYKDPAQVQSADNNQDLSYDAKLEDLNSKADNSNVTAAGQTSNSQQLDQSTKNVDQNKSNQPTVKNNQYQQDTVNSSQQNSEQSNNEPAQQLAQTNKGNEATPKLAVRSFAAQPANTVQKQVSQPAVQPAKAAATTTQKQAVQPAKAAATTAQKQAVQPAKAAATTASRSVAPTTFAAKTTATTSLPKYKPTVTSSINDYIRKNNFKAPTYEQDFSPYLPKYNYRYGKPEGIVVHDTANDSSNINGEVNYMKNNWQNAFVQGFIDGNRIVETADTDYLAWGAGPVANQRFIHIELVHEHSYDGFARQMNNYADYAATNLQYYGLSPDSAEYDGKGTVWTHYAISKYLGGTDHSDPHGYLQAHNYSYDQLYDLINEKYLIKEGKVAPWGTTASTTAKPNTNTSNTTKPSTTPTNSQLKVIPVDSIGRVAANNHGVYTTVYDKAGVQNSSINDRTYRLTKKALLGDKSFYLITDYNKNTNVGWVQTNDINYRVGKPVTTNTTTYSIQPGTKLYNTPWGSERQSIGSVTGTGSQQFKAQKQTEVGTSTYVYGAVNGKNAWVDNAKLSKYTAPKTAVKSVAAPKAQVKAASTTTPSTTKKTTATKTAAKPVVKTTTATKTAAKPVVKTTTATKTAAKPVAKSTTATKTVVKPVAKTATATKTAAKPVAKAATKTVVKPVAKAATAIKKAVQPTAKAATITKPAVKPVAKTTTATKAKSTSQLNQTVVVNKLGQYVSNQYGLRASVYDAKGVNAAKYLGYTYDILRERNQDGTLYYLLQNNDLSTPLGWVNAKDVKVVNQSNPTSVSTKYNVKQGNNGLYTMPWGTSKQQIDSLKQTNGTFQASKRKIVNGAAYVYGTVNGKTGWIAEKDLVQSNPKATTAPVKAQPATPYKHDYIVANAGSSYYNTPNGKILGSLKDQYGNIISVYEKQLVNGVTWYHGTLINGKAIWIKAADVRDTLTRTKTSNYTLDQASNIQSNSPWPPQVQRTPGKWVNATKDEVKTAMDSKTITEDATQKYQFLRLDKAQKLSASSVNQLLKGKGILEGQGAAFAQAAQKYDINEIYLISHALLETGNGTSTLANGGYVDNKNKVVTNSSQKFYNMFGIGAIDADAVRGGFKTAQNYGWDTVSKAIVGGAQFIKDAYINQGQNTLYRMRWNPSTPGNHKYATDINWASHNATRMKTMYDSIGESGKYFDVDNYKG